MAKKKPREEETPEAPKMESMLSAEIADETQATLDERPGNSVLEEVQTFLNQRAELARKLAEEIEATERKLAQLKQSAALLTPQSGGSAQREKKAKKASKPKPVARRDEPASEPAAPSDVE